MTLGLPACRRVRPPVRRLLLILMTVLFSPFLLALWVCLLACNLLGSLGNFRRRRAPEGAAPSTELASIVVLNWNGRDLLAEGIPSIERAVKADGRPHEILVVDNGSTDGSLEYLRRFHPDVRVLALPRNLGFAEGSNEGVRAARHDVVVLLNNDMVVDPGFLRPLLDGFRPETFAVSSRILMQDASRIQEETGRTTAVFRRGRIDFGHRGMDGPPFPRSYYPVSWAGGGASAFHRERFLALGGFRSLYSPAYVEDVDLSYQAWSLGWEVLMAPQSVVHHKHRATSLRLFSPSQLQVLITRNHFLFLWTNIQDWGMLLAHGFFLPWNCYRLTRDHGTFLWKSIFQAAVSLPLVLAAKLRAPFRRVLDDRRIFELVAKPGLYFAGRRNKPRGQRNASCGKPRVLWLTAYLPHLGRHGGAGRMFQLLKRIASDYSITLATFVESEDEQALVPELEGLCEKVVAVRRTPPNRWQPFAYEPFEAFRTPEMEEALDRCLEYADYDLIQMEYNQMARYADRIGRIPKLLTKHEVDFAAWARRAKLESHPVRKARWFYNYLQVLDRETKLTLKADAVICLTDVDTEELKKFCPSVPVHVIPSGVDLDYFRPPDRPADEPRLVFVGAFQHWPNVDAMLYFCGEVLPRVRSKRPDVELLIVGSQPPPRISSLSRIPGVTVTGWVSDIRPFMARSSVYIVPVRLGTGLRGKVLEAWSMKMPVVSTSVGCAGLRCEHGGNILVADSARDFASHIVSLLGDPLRRRRLGEEGRRTAERYYGWERAAQQLDTLYRQYLG